MTRSPTATPGGTLVLDSGGQAKAGLRDRTRTATRARARAADHRGITTAAARG
ncbi:DNA-binding protein, partial [Streptomyces prasinus]